jgi:hypothetical protein
MKNRKLYNPLIVVYDVYACENSILYKYQVTLIVFYSYFLSTREYWRNLGSSKTRTKEQEIKGRDLIFKRSLKQPKIQQ